MGGLVIAQAGGIDKGDTAWMLAATALVLLMTPGLGLFYTGLVRSKNALNTFMMSAGALGVVTVAWAFIGYSFAFDEGNGFIGGFGRMQTKLFRKRRPQQRHELSPGLVIEHIQHVDQRIF